MMSLDAHSAITCIKRDLLGPLHNTVIMKEENDIYYVTYFGGSRKSYEATYKIERSGSNRAGKWSYLSKLEDTSTSHDMPETLKVEYGNFYTGDTVLTGLSLGPVAFNNKECGNNEEDL